MRDPYGSREQVLCGHGNKIGIRIRRFHQFHGILPKVPLAQWLQMEIWEILWMLMRTRPNQNKVTRASRHLVLKALEITRTDSVKVTLAGGPYQV